MHNVHNFVLSLPQFNNFGLCSHDIPFQLIRTSHNAPQVCAITCQAFSSLPIILLVARHLCIASGNEKGEENRNRGEIILFIHKTPTPAGSRIYRRVTYLPTGKWINTTPPLTSFDTPVCITNNSMSSGEGRRSEV